MIYKEVTGRLGNQMFQYAAIKAYKEKYNLNDEIVLDFSKLKLLGKEEDGFCDQLNDFCICTYHTKKVKKTLKINFLIYYYKFIINYILKDEKKIYKFQCNNQSKMNKNGIFYFSYGYYDFPLIGKKNKYFFGDFESPKYFDNIRDDLLKEFTPKKAKLEKNKEMYNIIENSNSVCISIRRGDFVTNPEFRKKHLVCDEAYYYNAMKEMSKKVVNPRYIVFSDDVDWCRENMNFPNDTVYEDGTDPVWEKLRLMYSCKNFILSNSTFSWWAQYLSRNEKKVVIAPNKWKNYSYKEDGQFDIYEKSWIQIPVGDDINEK